jgi:hypothetical protein
MKPIMRNQCHFKQSMMVRHKKNDCYYSHKSCNNCIKAMKLKFKGELFQRATHQQSNFTYMVRFGVVHHQKHAKNRLQPNHL